MVLAVIAVVWDFGATLIWGTAGETKVRVDIMLGVAGRTGLLICAVGGILAAAAAVRSFDRDQTRAGIALAALCLVCFGAWSAAVRYPPLIALVGALSAALSFWWASRPPAADAKSAAWEARACLGGRGAALRTLPAVLSPCVSGLLFYAYLRWSPKSWADPQCGASFVVPVFAVAVAASGFVAWSTARVAGRRAEAVVATAMIAALLAAAICVVGFLLWFGQNHCGE